MKIKLGSRLTTLREMKRLSQNEMADLLAMSPAAYGRLERNETNANFEDLQRFSKVLDIPITDLLPELMTINNNNNQHQSGLIFGNINNYYDSTTYTKELEHQVKLLEQEVASLRRQLDALLPQ